MKRKIIALAIASLALSSCSMLPNMTPHRRPSSHDSSSVETSDIFSEHQHSWGDWVTEIAPTCYDGGQRIRNCTICGEVDKEYIDPLGHDFDNGHVVYDTSTCTADGYKQVRCSRCDATEDYFQKAHHRWDSSSTFPRSKAEYVKYKKANCSMCGKIRLSFAATDGTFLGGSSNKPDAPSGYLKLSNNGMSVSWKFNLINAFSGVLFQRAVMDGWNSSVSRDMTYNYNGGGNTFEMTVNGQLVDMSEYENETFYSMLDGGDDAGLGSSYSPIADCPIGYVNLVQGVNEIVFTRLNSYSLTALEFGVLGADVYDETPTHAHTLSDWQYDDNYHWQVCLASECPSPYGTHINESGHSFGEPFDVMEATCVIAGSYNHRCSICGFEERVEIPKLGHTFSDYPDATLGISDLYTCAVCGQSAIRWNAKDYDETKTLERSTQGPETRSDGTIRFSSMVNYRDGNTSNLGCHVVYNVTIPSDCNDVSLSFLASGHSTGTSTSVFNSMSQDSYQGYEYLDGELTRAESRYGLKVDGNIIFIHKDETEQHFISPSTSFNWYRFPLTLSLTAGTHEIELYNLGGYRVYISQLELSGFPHYETSHTHQLGDWFSDDDYHWRSCVAEGCPLDASAKFDYEEHSYGDTPVEQFAATCTRSGYEVYRCTKCGHIKTVTTYVEHIYASEPFETRQPTCSEPGYEKYKCINCDDVKTVPLYEGHSWSDGSTITSTSEGSVNYIVKTCKDCGATRIEIKAIDCTLVDGSTIKSGTPEGYFKLTNNGNSASWKFDYSGIATTAKIYQRGFIEDFNINTNRGYFTTMNGSSSEEGNFDVLFNGTLVDKSAMMNVTYEEMLKDGDPNDALSGASPIADCLIGEINLVNGTNEIIYQRLSSYNLVLSDFVIIIG